MSHELVVPVVLLHASEEETEAQGLARSIEEFGYDVWHTGRVLVGDVPVKELSERLALGGPVVICGTARAAGSKWLRKIVAHLQASSANGHPRIFPVRMDSDADLEAVGLGARIAECSMDRQSGLNELRKALAHHFPSGGAQHAPAAIGSDSPAGDFDAWLTRVITYSEGALRAFREKLRPEIREFRLPDSLDSDVFLAKANLALSGRLYSAGVLLFAAAPETTVGSAYVQCVHYSGSDRAAAQDGRELVGPLVSQLSDAMTFIENRIGKTDVIVPGSVAAQTEFQFPMVCLRELLANALCHRDYLDTKRHTHVRIFRDRIEIVSPGRWMARAIPERLELQLADLLSEPVSRNERLASALRWVRLVETQGSGIPNALTDCTERGAPPPVVMFTDEMVKVTIFPRRDWGSTSIVRRGVQIAADPQIHGVTQVMDAASVQCPICYSEVEAQPYCPECGSPLDESTVLRGGRVERSLSGQAAKYVVTLEPASLHYAQMHSRRSSSQSVRIENRGTLAVEILAIETDRPWLIVTVGDLPFTLVPAEASGEERGAVESHSFTVTCHPYDLAPGTHAGGVTVRLRDQPALHVSVKANVVEVRSYPDYIGIDLGTTNSVVAVLSPETRAIELVEDQATGSHLIPSVLVFDDVDTYKIGQAALNERDVAPDRMVRSLKLMLGYSRERQFFGRSFSAGELASLLIRKLLEFAEKKLLRDTGVYYSIHKAIVTVPASFFDVQIREMLNACSAAGLDTDEQAALRAAQAVQTKTGMSMNAGVMLDEPAAAILDYLDFLRRTRNAAELTKAIVREQGLKMLVFDYGGGTLDVAVASVTQVKGGGTGLRILANVGDNDIGGDHIDVLVMQELCYSCQQQLPQFGFDTKLIICSFRELERRCDAESWSVDVWRDLLRIRAQWKDLAEQAKIRIAQKKQVSIDVLPDLIVRVSGGIVEKSPRAVKINPLPAQTVSDLLQPVLARTDQVVRAALADAGVDPGEVDYILHTGRQSLLPQIRECVRAIFPTLGDDRDLLEEQHLKVCVAKGAALYGLMRDRLIANDARIVFLSEGRRLPHSYGVEMFTNPFEPEFDEVIARGEKYPVEKTKTYDANMITVSGRLNLKFYENRGHGRAIVGNPDIHLLGEISLDTTANGLPGCDVRFVVDANRILQVFADGQRVFIQPTRLEDKVAWWR